VKCGIATGRRFFDRIGERYKAEYIGEIPPSGDQPLPAGNFVDLCVGPHLPSTGGSGKPSS